MWSGITLRAAKEFGFNNNKHENELNQEIMAELIDLKRVYKINFKLNMNPQELFNKAIGNWFLNVLRVSHLLTISCVRLKIKRL